MHQTNRAPMTVDKAHKSVIRECIMLHTLKKVLILFIISMSFNVGLAQVETNTCPAVPSGLAKVSRLEWQIYSETAKVRLGKTIQNDYLQTWLEWDVFSGELRPFTQSGVVEAIQLAESLQLSDEFFGQNNPTHIGLSPSFQNALYAQTDTLSHLYTANIVENQTNQLGVLSANLSELSYLWYSDDEAVLSIKPIYGEGTEVIHVCLDGSCFVNLWDKAQYFFQPPDAFIPTKQLALMGYSQSGSIIFIYSLPKQEIEAEYQLTVISDHNSKPIWSHDGKSIYFIGFDTALAHLLVYHFDLETQKLETVTDLGLDISSINEWLIIPEKKIVILSTSAIPAISVHCFN